MKVFISWSGDRSRPLAEAIRSWLSRMFQGVVPFMSSEDATKGGRWAATLAGELEATRIGIVCLTPDNVAAPWIHFEAGALSKALDDRTKLCPLLFEMEPTEVVGPLAQFQCAKFSREEMVRVVQMMNNEAGDHKMTEAVLSDTFAKWWPDLEETISSALAASPPAGAAPRRDPREVQDEILSLVREIAGERDPKILDLVEGLQNVVALLFDIVGRIRSGGGSTTGPPVTLGEFGTAMHGGPRSFVTDQTPGTPSTGLGWTPTKT